MKLISLIIVLPFIITVNAYSKEFVVEVKGVYNPIVGLLDLKFIHIKNEKITKLEKKLDPKNKLDVINHSDRIALPGFIEAHTHLFLSDPSYDKDLSKSMVEISELTVEKRMVKAKQKAKSLLREGFVAIRDLGNSGRYLDVKLRDEIRLKMASGPNMYVSGPGICILKCQFKSDEEEIIVNKEYDVIKNFNEGKEKIDNHLRMGVEWIKIYSDNTPGTGVMDKGLLLRLVNYSKGLGLRVAIHAIEEKAVVQAVNVEPHSIEHIERLDQKYFEKMANKKISFVTTEFSDANMKKMHMERHFKIHKKEAALDIKRRRTRITSAQISNVNIAFGTDLYFPTSTDNTLFGKEVLKVINTYKRFGFSNKEIIKILTVNGAELLGLRNKYGELKVGVDASFVLVDKNPEKSIETLLDKKIVYKNGLRVQ